MDHKLCGVLAEDRDQDARNSRRQTARRPARTEDTRFESWTDDDRDEEKENDVNNSLAPPRVRLALSAHRDWGQRRVEDHVRNVVMLCRDVARWNRNQTWSRGLTLITSDVDEFNRCSVAPISDRFWGYWAYNHGLPRIYVRRQPLHRDELRTLGHELAHAFARGSHGATWRRLCVLLTPLVFEAYGLDGDEDVVDDVVYGVTSRYCQGGDDARIRERVRHRAAADRCLARFRPTARSLYRLGHPRQHLPNGG